MKKTLYCYFILSLLAFISKPVSATEPDFLNYECYHQPTQTKQFNTQNVNLEDPETLTKITKTLNKRGIESIEEIGTEAALQMYFVFYDIDYVEDIPENVKPKYVKPPKKLKKKKFQGVNQTVLPEKEAVVDLEAQKKREEEWQEQTLKVIQAAAEKFVKEQETHLSLTATSHEMKSILNLSSLTLFPEKQEIARHDFSVAEFVLEEPSALPINPKKPLNTKKPKKHVSFALPLPQESVQVVAPPSSPSNKKERKSLKKAENKATVLKNSSGEPLKYGELTILNRPQKATLSTADQIQESLTTLHQADSLNHYHHLYNLGVAPYGPLPGACFPIPYYPYLFSQPIVLSNVIITNPGIGIDYRASSFNASEHRYEREEPGVFIPGIHLGAEIDYRVGFYNEQTKQYEGVEPGVFIPDSHPTLGKIRRFLNKSSESN